MLKNTIYKTTIKFRKLEKSIHTENNHKWTIQNI